jgi:hypothetical protein
MTPVFALAIKLPDFISQIAANAFGTHCLIHHASVSGHDPDFLFA